MCVCVCVCVCVYMCVLYRRMQWLLLSVYFYTFTCRGVGQRVSFSSCYLMHNLMNPMEYLQYIYMYKYIYTYIYILLESFHLTAQSALTYLYKYTVYMYVSTLLMWLEVREAWRAVWMKRSTMLDVCSDETWGIGGRDGVWYVTESRWLIHCLLTCKCCTVTQK